MLLSIKNKNDDIFTVDTQLIFSFQYIQNSLYTVGVGCLWRGCG